MTRILNFPFLLLLFLAVGFSSCDKDTDDLIPDDPTPEPTTAPAPTPTISNADAALWAVKSMSSQTVSGMTIDMTIGVAAAAFSDGGDFNNLVDVGSVKVDGNSLTRHENNGYTRTPSTTEPTGLDFSSTVSWEIEGGSGYQNTTTSMNIAFPEMDAISSSTTISKSQGYTFTVGNTSGADSVLFQVGEVIKYVPGNATSCTFSSGELSGASTGVSVMIAAAFTSTPTNISGNMIYHGRETVRSKTIEITE